MEAQSTPRRSRLNRAKVLEAAVALADEVGIEALSMRRLAEELGVAPMALYKHVADKEDLLDGMVEVIVREIDPQATGENWKNAIRLRVLSARHTLQRHRWARQAMETRTKQTPAVLDYMESFIGTFLSAGFSTDLTHHVMHAIGGRMWGFTQELFDQSAERGAETSVEPPAEVRAAMLAQMAQAYPNIASIATSTPHDDQTVVGHGCDDEFEFRFALDLMLDGIERLFQQHWNSARAKAEVSW
mgnify:CR=1 FL=1